MSFKEALPIFAHFPKAGCICSMLTLTRMLQKWSIQYAFDIGLNLTQWIVFIRWLLAYQVCLEKSVLSNEAESISK